MKTAIPFTAAVAEAHQRHHGFKTVLEEPAEKKRAAGKLKLGRGAGTYYTPDFIAREKYVIDEKSGWQVETGRLICFEVKGKQKWDDAIVKFKTVYDRWRYLAKFEMWDKVDGKWTQLA